ncbi:MAG: PD40 domain-containing protein [Myxococcales bacterium]|nr:PD40 domain-containing protein [Myxococcales bacterium]
MRRLVPVLLSLSLAACNCSPSKPCSTTADCDPGSVCSRGVCQRSGAGGGGGDSDGGAGGGGGVVGGGSGGGDAGTKTATSLELTPPNAGLSSIDGSQPTQAFTAVVHYDDGTSGTTANAVFDVDVPVVGTVGPNDGLFTASGRVGGPVTVRAQLVTGGRTLSASALVTVSLQRTTVGVGVPVDVGAKFGVTPVQDPSRAAGVVYPLDRVVFPQNVAPADVQWLTGVSGDLFRVTLTKPNVRVVGYVAEDGDHHWLVDLDAWRALAQSSISSDATLTVDRWEASTQQVISGAPITLRFVPAALTGSIYYWDIQRGRIVRIDDGTTTRSEFMPSPPVATDNSQCVGCHAVSPKGRYMAGRLGGGENVGAVFDLTVNLTANPPPTVWPVVTSTPNSQHWWFSSWSPDETRMVLSINEGATGGMAFIDPLNGQSVAVANVPAGKMTHPAWSPDGQKIAYAVNLNGWGGDFTAADLHVVPVTAPDTLGTPSVLHTGASLAGSTPSGNADSYPTWTPDSKKVAFAHGNGCRSETHQAALYLMDADGTNVVRLSNSTGGPSSNDSFQPRFSPFRAGGYYWLTYLSRRDYGNAQVGTRGSGFQQIWVVGIKENAVPGTDPSEVAFWLPGQDTRSRNIAAYWAPRPCRQAGDSCTVGSECCSGDCRAGTSGGPLVCSPPPPERCRNEGETCGATGDCCPGRGLVCSMNVCIIDIQ